MTGIKENPPAVVSGKEGSGVQQAELKDTAQIDCAQAIGFLRRHTANWQPEWFVQLCTFDPRPEATAVLPADLDKLAPWIDAHSRQNLYFAVNPLHRDPRQKCSKADVAALAYAHVDLDPVDGKPLAAERERLLAAVQALQIPPTELIDSGNGFGLFWRLQDPIAHDGNTAALEDANQRLAHNMHADHCHNIDRVMRLPGTVNFPTESKLKKGRSPVPVPTALLCQTDTTVTLDAFEFLPRLAPKVEHQMPATGIGEPIRLGDYGLTDDQQALCGNTLPKGTRSEAAHSLLTRLLNDGHSRSDVLATIHNEAGLRFYCTDKHPNDPAGFALAELSKAWAESWAGILARIGWENVDPAVIRAFAGTPIAVNSPPQGDQIRFDAKPTTLTELDADDLPIQYVIDPVYPLETPGEFDGAHGIGKSINALEQCACVAAGRPWAGLKVIQGKAVFASWEDPRSVILRRLKTWLRNIKNSAERDAAKQAIAENLIVLGCDEIDLMLTTKAFGACSVRDDVVDLIIERCRGSILVMLETAALMHGGDELNEDLAQLAKAVKRITNGTRAAVVTVRHVSKDAARNKVVDAYVGRGGGSFTGAMRSMVVLVEVPAEDVRKKGIGLGDAAVAMGRQVLAYYHVKANYGGRMKEPIYLVVMPDGHMERVAGPDERQAQSDLLLDWLRENMEDGGLAYTAIRKARKQFGNPQQGMVRVLLGCLENDGYVKHKKVPGRGRYAEVEMWQLVELVKGA